MTFKKLILTFCKSARTARYVELAKAKDYSHYVEHRRYGRGPRFTGFNLNPESTSVHLHRNTNYWTKFQLAYCKKMGYDYSPRRDGTGMIPGTAVRADVNRQIRATFQVTHYYDIDEKCGDCNRRFIFFAKEQAFWYEDLHIPLDVCCERCSDCRKVRQRLALKRRRYEELIHRTDRTTDETLEMAHCCLTLVEDGAFHARQTQHVRRLLKNVPDDRRSEKAYGDIRARLIEFETRIT